MGRRVHIVTHRQPIKLRIIGLYGQVELGPVEIRATVNASEVASYRTSQSDTEVLKVPANASDSDGERYLLADFLASGHLETRSPQSFARQLRNFLRFSLFKSNFPSGAAPRPGSVPASAFINDFSFCRCRRSCTLQPRPSLNEGRIPNNAASH